MKSMILAKVLSLLAYRILKAAAQNGPGTTAVVSGVSSIPEWVFRHLSLAPSHFGFIVYFPREPLHIHVTLGNAFTQIGTYAQNSFSLLRATEIIPSCLPCDIATLSAHRHPSLGLAVSRLATILFKASSYKDIDRDISNGDASFPT